MDVLVAFVTAGEAEALEGDPYVLVRERIASGQRPDSVVMISKITARPLDGGADRRADFITSFDGEVWKSTFLWHDSGEEQEATERPSGPLADLIEELMA